MILNLHSRAVTRATTTPGSLSRPHLSPRTTHRISLDQFHRLGSVRHFEVRRVVSGSKNGKQATSHNDGPSRVAQVTPQLPPSVPLLRYSRKPVHVEGSQSKVEEWLSNLILPPDTYYDRFSAALTGTDAGGLPTAEKLVFRWSDRLPKVSTRVWSDPDGKRRISECTSEFSMPLLGLRKVISYGHDTVRSIMLDSEAFRG